MQLFKRPQNMVNNMNTFTPGPWLVGRYGSIVTNNARVPAAEQTAQDVYRGRAMVCHGVSRKDAPVIARAPHLYAILNEMLELLDESAVTPIDNTDPCKFEQSFKDALAAARVAIATIDGEVEHVVADEADEDADETAEQDERADAILASIDSEDAIEEDCDFGSDDSEYDPDRALRWFNRNEGGKDEREAA
jgi:hypothetical protein